MNGQLYDISSPITNTNYYRWQGFNGYGHGVCNVGFADGHVDVIPNMVKAITYREVSNPSQDPVRTAGTTRGRSSTR